MRHSDWRKGDIPIGEKEIFRLEKMRHSNWRHSDRRKGDIPIGEKETFRQEKR